MKQHERIVRDPKVMLGKPVIRGTRITVELILRKLGEGATHKDLLEAYPHLSEADIQAAITYAADTIAHERCSWSQRGECATNLAALHVPPHMVEKLLNHASGMTSGVAAIYNRFQYGNESGSVTFGRLCQAPKNRLKIGAAGLRANNLPWFSRTMSKVRQAWTNAGN